MKAYTDLEQSKKLAEILPMESADMFYADLFVNNEHKYIVHPLESYGFKTFKDTNGRTSRRLNFIPCWSLAALLGLMPKEINVLGTIYSIDIHTNNEEWFIDYKCNNEEFVGVYSNIFVDACYEMIVKLHEQNIL